MPRSVPPAGGGAALAQARGGNGQARPGEEQRAAGTLPPVDLRAVCLVRAMLLCSVV